ncbi:DNA methyltransferase [Desulfobacca acetoxidans]
MSPAWKNKLFFGDNLDILRNQIDTASVDLIYLDPPFNSQATYNILFAEKSGELSAAQITAFEDTWHWNLEAEKAYREVVTFGSKKVADLVQAFRSFLGTNDLMAYLVMMAPRLIELHRVLKPLGSIFLHCDPTASHYLKLLMDAIFNHKNFCNEIIWHYRKWPTGKFVFQRNHDVILFYSRSESRKRTFHQLYMERAASTLKRFGKSKIISGYDELGKRRPSKTEEEESIGVRQDDVWNIGRVPPIKQLFPTQKPESLLARIIMACSNEGDVVLDPFCGCGTTVVVAERMNRHWIGIDITHLAISLIKHRLTDVFGTELSPYEEFGLPQDYASAEALANLDRYQFEWWALSLVEARPARDKRQGADTGVDGFIYFFDDNSGKAKKVIVQVKSGAVNVSQVRDLKGVLEREKAALGVFLTLREPTGPMRHEAATAGFYEPENFSGQRFPRLQIYTISELLGGQRVQLPAWAPIATFKKASRRRKDPMVQEQQNDINWQAGHLTKE